MLADDAKEINVVLVPGVDVRLASVFSAREQYEVMESRDFSKLYVNKNNIRGEKKLDLCACKSFGVLFFPIIEVLPLGMY